MSTPYANVRYITRIYWMVRHQRLHRGRRLLHLSARKTLLQRRLSPVSALLVNCCIAVTYPLNLFVYCAMSERFRRLFCAIFSCPTGSTNAARLEPVAE